MLALRLARAPPRAMAAARSAAPSCSATRARCCTSRPSGASAAACKRARTCATSRPTSTPPASTSSSTSPRSTSPTRASTPSCARTSSSTCPTTRRDARAAPRHRAAAASASSWSRSRSTASAPTRTRRSPTPEDREREFLQHDHVRLYARDIAGACSAAGFDVEVVDMHAGARPRAGGALPPAPVGPRLPLPSRSPRARLRASVRLEQLLDRLDLLLVLGRAALAGAPR